MNIIGLDITQTMCVRARCEVGPRSITSLSHTLVLCVTGQLWGPLLTRLSKLKLLRSAPSEGPNSPQSTAAPQQFDRC